MIGKSQVVLFNYNHDALSESLVLQLKAESGHFSSRQFPDSESYLRILSTVKDRVCLIVADMSSPDCQFLPLVFLAETLRELGAVSVGLLVPYLCYMRQDTRFNEGEALTSAIFARQLSLHVDWLVTVDPHLHRYHSLSEIYSIPTAVVPGAPVLADWFTGQKNLVLIGPDEESEQWVGEIARRSGHPYAVGSKQRLGDRQVEIVLPDISKWKDGKAVIIDDVISSGNTVFKCIEALQKQGYKRISCACIHGLFADGVDAELLLSLEQLVSTNTIPHGTNYLDVSSLLLPVLQDFIARSIKN